jgi:hypothetical protein
MPGTPHRILDLGRTKRKPMVLLSLGNLPAAALCNPRRVGVSVDRRLPKIRTHSNCQDMKILMMVRMMIMKMTFITYTGGLGPHRFQQPSIILTDTKARTVAPLLHLHLLLQL